MIWYEIGLVLYEMLVINLHNLLDQFVTIAC